MLNVIGYNGVDVGEDGEDLGEPSLTLYVVPPDQCMYFSAHCCIFIDDELPRRKCTDWHAQ